MKIIVQRLTFSFVLWGVIWVALGTILGSWIQWIVVHNIGYDFSLAYIINLPILLLFLIAPLIIWMNSYVLKPVKEIINSNKEIAKGHLQSASIPTERIPSNEIGEIMKTRNEMLDSLLSHQKQIEEEKRRIQARLYEEMRRTSISRPMAGRIMKYLSDIGHLSSYTCFLVGRRLADELALNNLEDFLRTYKDMGLGSITLVSSNDYKRVAAFSGRDLLECHQETQEPTDHLTLGFLCGAISKIHGGIDTRGVEIECRSIGDEYCHFIIHWEKNRGNK